MPRRRRPPIAPRLAVSRQRPSLLDRAAGDGGARSSAPADLSEVRYRHFSHHPARRRPGADVPDRRRGRGRSRARARISHVSPLAAGDVRQARRRRGRRWSWRSRDHRVSGDSSFMRAVFVQGDGRAVNAMMSSPDRRLSQRPFATYYISLPVRRAVRTDLRKAGAPTGQEILHALFD